MKRLCTICARGGSKEVKNKNIRPLLGKPLIAHTIEQAFASGLFEAVAVSSDSDEILQVSKEAGVKLLIKRPDAMASDTAPKLEAIRHCAAQAQRLSSARYETFVDLDATAPFRSVSDIQGAVSLLESSQGAHNVITAAPARKSPYFNLVELDATGTPRLSKPPVSGSVVRRQDSPKCFDMNASIYVWTYEALFNQKELFTDKTLLFEMPVERSVEIDTEIDFEIAEYLGRKKGKYEPLPR